MNAQPSVLPRVAFLIYLTIVAITWTLALSSTGLSPLQNWPIIVGLPWSLVLSSSGALGSVFGLFALFLAGVLNAGILHVLLRPRFVRRVTTPRALLPPAA